MSYQFNPFTGTFEPKPPSAQVPTFIPDNSTYTVEADKQVLFRKKITLGDGAKLKLDGILVET